MVIWSVLSAHLTVLLRKMVQWTAGVRIITSGQTKTLHPWLVPVSSFAATHASMFVLFVSFSSCYCAVCFCFKAFGPFPSVARVQIESFLCFTLHAWLTTNATFIIQNELYFKALPATQPPERENIFCVLFRFCITYDRIGEVIDRDLCFYISIPSCCMLVIGHREKD